MQTVKYEEILVRLDKALEFCHSLGLGQLVEKGRFGEYRRRINHLLEVVRKRAAGENVGSDIEAEQVNYRVALAESTEFGDLLSYLESCDPRTVIEKLEDVLTGPALPGAENDRSSSNRPRNIQFELFLGARLARTRFKPELGKWPDLKM